MSELETNVFLVIAAVRLAQELRLANVLHVMMIMSYLKDTVSLQTHNLVTLPMAMS